MMKTSILWAGAAAALLSVGAFAQSPPADPATQPAQESQRGATFESLDANSDGKISKAEAEANASVSAQFSKYDQNGDGFIERQEVNSANEAKPESPNKQ